MILAVNQEIKLKPLSLADAKNIFATIDSERDYLGKWLPFVEHTTKLKDTQLFIKSVLKVPKEQAEYVFTIRKNDCFAGIIGFRSTDYFNKKTEIGYWLSEKYQKQGIVTDSVQCLCKFAFNMLNMNRIQIRCAVDNKPSNKVPQRLNFVFEGIERKGELLTGGIFTDLNVYSLLKSEIGQDC